MSIHDSIIKQQEAVYRADQDARAAIRFIRKNCSLGRIDSGRIFMAGASAGAITALNVAYLDQNEIPQSLVSDWGNLDGLDKYDYPGYSTRIKGIINLEGVLADTSYIDSGDAPILSFYGSEDQFYKGSEVLKYDIISPHAAFFGGKSIYKRAINSGIVAPPIVVYAGGNHGSVYDSAHINITITRMSDALYSQIF